MHSFSNIGWLAIVTIIELTILLASFSTIFPGRLHLVSAAACACLLSWGVAYMAAQRDSPTLKADLLAKQIWCVILIAIAVQIVRYF